MIPFLSQATRMLRGRSNPFVIPTIRSNQDLEPSMDSDEIVPEYKSSNPVKIHQDYLVSVPGAYDILQEWHPIVHYDYDIVNHKFDSAVDSLIRRSPWINPPSYVYWFPVQEFECNRNFNSIKPGYIFQVNYPIIVTSEPRSNKDTLIELSAQSKVLFFPEDIMILPSQRFEVLDSKWTRGYVKSLYLKAF